jgi:hypothetical protein
MFLLIGMYWLGIKDGRVGIRLVLYYLTCQIMFVYNGMSALLKDVDYLLIAKSVSQITTRRSASTVAYLLGAAG